MDDVLKVIAAILVTDCCVTMALVLLAVLFVKPLRPPKSDQQSASSRRTVNQ